MNKNYNDLPSIMNSVSYHLKRIADELEVINDKNTAKTVMEKIKTKPRTTLDNMLEQVKSEELKKMLKKVKSNINTTIGE